MTDSQISVEPWPDGDRQSDVLMPNKKTGLVFKGLVFSKSLPSHGLYRPKGFPILRFSVICKSVCREWHRVKLVAAVLPIYVQAMNRCLQPDQMESSQRHRKSRTISVVWSTLGPIFEPIKSGFKPNLLLYRGS